MTAGRKGSWLSAAGPYRQLVEDLCASDPRLRQSDPKTRNNAVRRSHHQPRVVSLQLGPDGSFGSPLKLDSPQSLRQHLDAGPPSTDPDSRMVYILEGPSPEYVAPFGACFGMHPSLFAEHERTVVFSEWAHQESDSLVLPSLMAGREHETLHYFELFVLPEEIRGTFILNCAATGRHIGATRNFNGFSEVGILRRKCSLWRRRRAGTGWDCLIITDPPLREVRVNKSRVVSVSVAPYQGGYLDIVPFTEQQRVRSGPRRVSMLDDLCFYLLHHAGLMNPGDPDSVGLFATKIIASQFVKQADYLQAIASSIAWRLSRKDQVPFTTETVEVQWSDTQSLERRMSEYCEQLEAAMMQLRVPLEQPDPSKPQPWSDVKMDFQFLRVRFRDIRQRVMLVNAAMTTAASIAGNRQAVKEAKKTKALTVLGLIFIPLAYTASLFSMAEPYSPGFGRFWVYFAVSAPLILLLFGIFHLVSKVYDGGGLHVGHDKY